jgi:hypothetical protein
MVTFTDMLRKLVTVTATAPGLARSIPAASAPFLWLRTCLPPMAPTITPPPATAVVAPRGLAQAAATIGSLTFPTAAAMICS